MTVLEKLETNGYPSKFGRTILHNLISLRNFKIKTIVSYERKYKARILIFSYFSFLGSYSLKNKGKYEISFRFTLEDAHGKDLGEPLEDLFKIQPASGTLTPIDRPTQVQVQFNTKSEVQISEVPILKCHVIEPNMSDSGEIIASIPIKVTVGNRPQF